MAIALDNATASFPGGVTGVTFAYTTSGTNRVLIVVTSTSSPTVSTTYNGVSMSQIVQSAPTSPCGRYDTLFYLANPASGTNNVVVSGGGTNGLVYYGAVSYTGASQGASPDNSASTTNASETVNTNTITPSAANCWHVAIFETSNPSQGTNVGTQRAIANTAFGIYDTNGTITAGVANSLSVSQSGAVCDNSVGVTIAPFVSTAVTATDSTAVSDTPTIFITSQKVLVSDSSAVSDTTKIVESNNILKTDSTAVSDSPVLNIFTESASGLLGSLYASGYKWLTNTLLAAQQSFAIQPYFTAKVIDDTIQPNADLQNGSGTFAGNFAALCTAPDGKVIAVGYNSAVTSVDFYVGSDLNASSGLLTDQKVLDSNALSVDPNNKFAIACSDWHLGTYEIDIWYFTNFANNGTDLKIRQQHSNNAGATWTQTDYTVAGGTLPNNQILTTNLTIAAAQPWWDGTLMHFGAFYTKKNANTFVANFSGYDIYFTGNVVQGLLTDTIWSPRNVNSGDWTLFSLSAFYINNTQFVCFSGFRNVVDTAAQFAIFTLWTTAMLNQTNEPYSSLWTAPTPIMPLFAASPLNTSDFINQTATVANGKVYITFRADLVDSIAQSPNLGTSVSVHHNCMLITSDNGTQFSYPSVFVDQNNIEFPSLFPNFFVPQANYWYLGGSNGYMWQYIQNNIVADLSEDVIGYQVQDQSGQPSSISLQIANANNKWIGSNPTGAGAAAIARNRKIAVWQGYHTSSPNSPEVVPRDIYYIDDVQQNVTGTNNDVTLVGRDFFKNLKVTVTKFLYQFTGPLFYFDIFDGTTNSNWSQQSGTWTFYGTPGNGITTPSVQATAASGTAVLALGTQVHTTYGALTRVFFEVPASINPGYVFVYVVYVDSGNWIRCGVEALSGLWKVEYSVAGSITVFNTNAVGTGELNPNTSYALICRRYDYYKFNFVLSASSPGITAAMNAYDPSQNSYLFAQPSAAPEEDLSSIINNNVQLQAPFTVALGMDSTIGTSTFHHFMHSTYNNRSTLLTTMGSLGRLASIFSYKFPNTVREYLFSPSFTGSYTVANRILGITAGNDVIYNASTFTDGEITFQAKLSPSNPSVNAGFSFVFRANATSGITDAYKLHILQVNSASGAPLYCRFERLYSSNPYYFYNSEFDANNVFGGTAPIASAAQSPTLNFDPTQWHTYRIEMINSQMFAYIDDVMVASWNDDNTTTSYLTTGYWGFETDANTSLFVQKMRAPSFWKPVPSFSYNPGDDAESAMMSLIQTLRAWFFSDMLGRFKAIFLNSSDPSTYTYDAQLYSQTVDNSDKEYVAQVTVFGNPPIMATARNTSLLAGVPTRELVVVDYSILTQADAQTRANNELNNAGQYLNQYAPTQVVNVGSELFDAVTVINTGNNTSGIDSPTRIYAETFNEGGGNNSQDYSVEISTGNIN
jgi:hypothetical protein